MRVTWDTSDPSAAIGTAPCGLRFVAWFDGALSGDVNRTTYHETQKAAQAYAESIVTHQEGE